MKKLHFGRVHDIAFYSSDKYRIVIDDLVTERRYICVLKLDDVELDYLHEVDAIPFIFEKVSGRYYVRPLMCTFDLKETLFDDVR